MGVFFVHTGYDAQLKAKEDLAKNKKSDDELIGVEEEKLLRRDSNKDHFNSAQQLQSEVSIEVPEPRPSNGHDNDGKISLD